ncbi:MAG: hypothetical protein ACOYJ6_18660, partial [Caulobacterales bacterium]
DLDLCMAVDTSEIVSCSIGDFRLSSRTMSSKDQLLHEIEAFIARHQIPASVFGLAAVSDRGFVGRLRRGGDVRLDTADRVREFMSAYVPQKKRGHSGAVSAVA